MATSMNIYEARTHFSRLVSRVESGEEITLSRNGRPVARIIPIVPTRIQRRPGAWRGKVAIADTFDELTAGDVADWYPA